MNLKIRTCMIAGAAVAASIAAVATAGSGPAEAASRATAPAAAAGKVGSGWAVATWSRTADSSGTLFLISPTGHRRAVAAAAPHARPVAWSPDGKRVLVEADSGVVQVTLRTGHATRVALPEDSRTVSYSRPRGLAILAAVFTEVHDRTGSHLTDRLERFGTDARRQQAYPVSIKGAGHLDADAAIENRDGTEIVVGVQRGLVLLRNNGSVVRRLLGALRDCEVSSWWRRDVALASCNGTLWAAPISGAKPARISAGPAKPNEFGYSTAWRVSNGTLGLAPNGCGPQSLVRFGAHGVGTRLTVPLPIARQGRPSYVGHAGDRVLMTVKPGSGCMSAPTTLFAYNAVSHRSTALLGPAVNGGTVQGAITYPVD